MISGEYQWVGKNSLKSNFPVLYSISSQKQVMIKQMWSQQNWHFNFRRTFNDLYSKTGYNQPNVESTTMLFEFQKSSYSLGSWSTIYIA